MAGVQSTNATGSSDANKAIFYKAIKSSDVSQLGGEDLAKGTKETKESANYADGLSIFEMTNLDSNNDGVLTRDEFNASKIDDIDKKWQDYFGSFEESEIDFDNDGYVDTNGYSATGKDIHGAEYKDGKLTSYKIKAKDDSGETSEVTRTVKDSKLTGTKAGNTELDKKKFPVTRETTNDGTTITGSEDSAAGKTTVKLNKDGKLTEVKNDIAGINMSGMEYDSNGILTKIKIGDTEYDSNSIKANDKGATTITCSDGTKIEITAPAKDGKVRIYTYDKNGEKSTGMTLNKKLEPQSVVEYKDGKEAVRYFAGSNKMRKYKYDSDNKPSATDYVYSGKTKKEGRKTGEQTYQYSEKLKKYVRSEKTSQDSDEKNKETVKYDESGNRKEKTVTFTYDENGKRAEKRVTKNNKTVIYTWDSDKNKWVKKTNKTETDEN